MHFFLLLATLDTSIRVFHVGNSLTWDSAPQVLADVPQSLGSPQIENAIQTVVFRIDMIGSDST